MTAAPAPADFRIRERLLTDEPFCYNSFLRTMRDEVPFAGIGNDAFYGTLSRAMDQMLASFRTLVAHPEGEEDEIAGYILARGNALGFLYVKREPWRRQGVARLLWEAAGLHKAETVQVLFPVARAMAVAVQNRLPVRPCSHVRAMALIAGAA